MFVTKKRLPRRTFLRAAGVTIALPLLDSMVPAQTPLRKTAANPKLRLGFCYIPHGAVMSAWTPEKEGALELTRILAPLQSVRDQIVVVSGLAQKNAGGGHGRSPSVFLSGASPRRTEREDVRAGVTVDQIAASVIGQDTPLPSMELAAEDMTGLIGACEPGFSYTYANTISWRTPATPLPMEINPRAVFHMLFGEGGNASVLDGITAQAARLKQRLGANDRNRVAEYLDGVRETERRVQPGIPIDHEEHSKLMMDLIALAFEAEITRVSSFMMARELSCRTFPKIGVPDPFHAASHHQDIPEKIEKLTKINAYHVSLVAYLLEKLKSRQDGDGTLLDHSLILYGSSMSNPNLHDHAPLPVFLAGGANGQLKGGRHVKYPSDTPMANLLTTILDYAGARGANCQVAMSAVEPA